MDSNFNPHTFEFEGILYRVSYDHNSDGEVQYFQVTDENGTFVFEMDHEGPITAVGIVNYMIEDEDIADDVSERARNSLGVSPPPMPIFTDKGAETERKLDEILKVLKKIEKNTRKK